MSLRLVGTRSRAIRRRTSRGGANVRTGEANRKESQVRQRKSAFAEAAERSLDLLAPASRKAGLGRRVHDAFESYAFKCGAERLLLAVLEENIGAHRFWFKLGYRAVKNHPPRCYGRRVHACTEY